MTKHHSDLDGGEAALNGGVEEEVELRVAVRVEGADVAADLAQDGGDLHLVHARPLELLQGSVVRRGPSRTWE